MKRLIVVASVAVGLATAGCGHTGGGKVSSASLQRRLPTASGVPGFGLQRTLDWSDPVDLVGQGLFLPQATSPSAAVKMITNAHFRGAAGEILTSGGSGPNATEIRLGVAQFKSPADANHVRDWMHREDLRQPCYSACIFAPSPVTVAGMPSLRMVAQTSHVPPPPPGAPPGARVSGGPTNYLAEFTVGPYLYWSFLQADAAARARFETGVEAYYREAKKAS